MIVAVPIASRASTALGLQLYLFHQVEDADPNEYLRLWRRLDESGGKTMRCVALRCFERA